MDDVENGLARKEPTMIAFVLGAALLGSFCLALTACAAVSLL